MKSIVFTLCFLVYFYNIQCLTTVINSEDGNVRTIVNTIKNASSSGSISYRVIETPHHLFIGRCKPEDQVIHQEHIVVHNDGKSHVAAAIRVQVRDPVNITCAKIYDQVTDGKGGYPSFAAGGIGHDFLEFNVDTEYGRGFHFFIQLYGYSLKEQANSVR